MAIDPSAHIDDSIDPSVKILNNSVFLKVHFLYFGDILFHVFITYRGIEENSTDFNTENLRLSIDSFFPNKIVQSTFRNIQNEIHANDFLQYKIKNFVWSIKILE